MGIRVSPTVTVQDLLAGLLGRMRDFTRPLKAGTETWRDLIRREFDSESWERPARGRAAWLPTRAFGNTPPPRKTLQRSGALRRAWLGEGPGSILRITRSSATLGVSGDQIPYAAVHRGGAGKVLTAQARQPQLIRVTPRMRIFLGLNKGVWLRRDTDVISIPRRPHATDSPELATRLAAIFSAWLARRPLPRFGA